MHPNPDRSQDQHADTQTIIIIIMHAYRSRALMSAAETASSMDSQDESILPERGQAAFFGSRAFAVSSPHAK